MLKRLALILILLVIIPGLAAAEVNQVRLHKTARVDSETVHLCDIAKISGPDTTALNKIRLIRSPAGKTGIDLSAEFIAGKIKAATDAGFSLSGTSVNVARRYVRVKPQELRGIYVRSVMEQSPWKGRGEIIIEDVRVPDNVEVLSSDRHDMQANFSPREDFVGTVSLRMAFGSSRKLSISGRVRVIADIPVSKGIQRGGIVNADMLEMKRMDVSRLGDVFTDADKCLGMRAKTAINAGRPILKNNLEPRPMVARGDMVIIMASKGNLLVTSRGMALRDGLQAQRIPVKNLSSGRQVVGTIIAPSRVQVVF